MAIITHSDAGQSAELFEWLDLLEGPAKKNYEKIDLGRSLDAFNAGFMRPKSRKPLRKELFLLLSQDPILSKRLFPDFRDLSNILRRAKLTEEEVDEWIQESPADYPRRAEWLLEWANRYSNAKDKWDKAIIRYQQAIEQAEKDGNPTLVTRVKAWQAFRMKKSQKKAEEATSIMESLDLSQVTESEWERFKKEFPDLKKKEAPSKENEPTERSNPEKP